jgi:hypothetical protein
MVVWNLSLLCVCIGGAAAGRQLLLSIEAKKPTKSLKTDEQIVLGHKE